MGRAVVLACLSVVLSALALAPATDALGFTCNSPPETTCRALVGYISPNTTTFRSIQTLFSVKHLRSLLAVNNCSTTLSPNTTVRAQETVFIPFTCRCSNGTGISDRSPLYTVQKDHGLYYIASSVFSYLVAYQDIQQVNRIENANLIEVGQKLWIPLPCSCDEVDGNKAVHYAHVVAEGSTVEQIAEEFGVAEKTIMDLNGLASAKELMADKALDVPLKACASKIHNDSLDADLLAPNGTYAITANNCVRCSCDSANNWTSVSSSSNSFRNLNTYSQKSLLSSSTFSSDQDQAPPAVVPTPPTASEGTKESSSISASQVLAMFGGVGGLGAAFWFGWYLRGKLTRPASALVSQPQAQAQAQNQQFTIQLCEASNDKKDNKGKDEKDKKGKNRDQLPKASNDKKKGKDEKDKKGKDKKKDKKGKDKKDEKDKKGKDKKDKKDKKDEKGSTA